MVKKLKNFSLMQKWHFFADLIHCVVIGIVHVYFEWRNDAKNGVKSPTLYDFILSNCLIEAIVESREEIDQHK